MVGFTLNAHVCGRPRPPPSTASAPRSHSRAATCTPTPSNRRSASARDDVGRFLVTASRGERPLGLTVSVGSVSASYGDPHPGAVPQLSGPPADPSSLVARIRNRWRDSDSPRSALENAIEIIRAYSRDPRRQAA